MVSAKKFALLMLLWRVPILNSPQKPMRFNLCTSHLCFLICSLSATEMLHACWEVTSICHLFPIFPNLSVQLKDTLWDFFSCFSSFYSTIFSFLKLVFSFWQIARLQEFFSLHIVEDYYMMPSMDGWQDGWMESFTKIDHDVL